jgi:hypothetical protein
VDDFPAENLRLHNKEEVFQLVGFCMESLATIKGRFWYVQLEKRF